MPVQLSEKDQARELVNSIYQPLGFLSCIASSDQMWEWAKDRAKEQLDLMLDQIPMYQGNLNPKWKYWDDVRKELRQLP